MDLITIFKVGEEKLRIHPDALEEHEKLGWQAVPDDEPEKPKRKAKAEPAEGEA
ncbi:hypothetical protein [Aquitalea sp. USM4]|uniref:hypothetical protein n=1 Tax=Aquitalea sp. USM4 TaxID=1590041 RepID=UPI0013F15B54|nr:hypothetical protein [Aquitalea sp. USM4]